MIKTRCSTKAKVGCTGLRRAKLIASAGDRKVPDLIGQWII